MGGGIVNNRAGKPTLKSRENITFCLLRFRFAVIATVMHADFQELSRLVRSTRYFFQPVTLLTINIF